MSGINFVDADLSRLLYIKVTYDDLEGVSHEVKTDVKFVGDKYISVFFRYEDEFKITYPQTVKLRFICDGAVYAAESTIREIKRTASYIFFTLVSPEEIVVQQSRKYFRIKLDRVCILLATNKQGSCEAFMSRLIDISGGGVLIHKLESMYEKSIVEINPDDYERFNLVLILGLNTIVKLSARFVRLEKNERSAKYAFEYIDVAEKTRDTICRFVTKEETEQLKLQKKR